MAVKIRLARTGAKKRPYYRIVAADADAPRDGRFLERLGTYDPNANPSKVIVSHVTMIARKRWGVENVVCPHKVGGSEHLKPTNTRGSGGRPAVSHASSNAWIGQ